MATPTDDYNFTEDQLEWFRKGFKKEFRGNVNLLARTIAKDVENLSKKPYRERIIWFPPKHGKSAIMKPEVTKYHTFEWHRPRWHRFKECCKGLPIIRRWFPLVATDLRFENGNIIFVCERKFKGEHEK